MSQDEFNQKVIEHLIALGERLESIERMLGKVEQEPEWHRKETAPDGKLVRITAGGFQGDLIGIKVEQNLWRAWKLNDHSNEVLFIPNVLVYSWRELNIEESAYAWENRILGASAEHAELSTLEIPIAKQEPEWRPMSAAPAYQGARIEVVTHNNVVAKVTFDPDYIYHPWRFDTYNGFGGDELMGWRPL